MSEPSTSAVPAASKLAEESRRWFLGSQAWIRVTSEQSGGSVAMVEHLIPPGSESPWHLHRDQDETWYVLEGTVTFVVGESRWRLRQGDCAFGPRNIPHGFRVDGDAPARILFVATPASGFDRFVFEGSEPATAPGFPPPQPPDIPRLSQLAARYHHSVLGPLPK